MRVERRIQFRHLQDVAAARRRLHCANDQVVKVRIEHGRAARRLVQVVLGCGCADIAPLVDDVNFAALTEAFAHADAASERPVGQTKPRQRLCESHRMRNRFFRTKASTAAAP